MSADSLITRHCSRVSHQFLFVLGDLPSAKTNKSCIPVRARHAAAFSRAWNLSRVQSYPQPFILILRTQIFDHPSTKHPRPNPTCPPSSSCVAAVETAPPKRQLLCRAFAQLHLHPMGSAPSHGLMVVCGWFEVKPTSWRPDKRLLLFGCSSTDCFPANLHPTSGPSVQCCSSGCMLFGSSIQDEGGYLLICMISRWRIG
jgi:hypothetical protein